jgi:hypothetical protein
MEAGSSEHARWNPTAEYPVFLGQQALQQDLQALTVSSTQSLAAFHFRSQARTAAPRRVRAIAGAANRERLFVTKPAVTAMAVSIIR